MRSESKKQFGTWIRKMVNAVVFSTLGLSTLTGIAFSETGYPPNPPVSCQCSTEATSPQRGGDNDCLDGRLTMNGNRNCTAIFKSLDTSAFAPTTCGDGQIDAIIDNFENASLWSTCYCGVGVPGPLLAISEGCSGNALAVSYDLSTEPIKEGWFVITRTFTTPLNLSNYSHLRIALRGSNINARHTLQIKLVNHVGDSDRLYWRTAESVTDLPVWRPLYIDLKEFTCFGVEDICGSQPPLDVSAITRIEIGASRCVRANEMECETPSENSNVLYLDELAAVDLRPGASNRLVQGSLEQVVPNPDLRSSTASAILYHQDSTGLVPAWFDESTANYNTYAEAMALHLFIDEYERTNNADYRNAANRLAQKLLALQIPDAKTNAGAWYTAYKNDAGNIVSMDTSCTGDEDLTADIDRCSWIGNTGWMVIGLARLKKSGIYSDVPALSSSIDKAAIWMVRQIGRISEYPGLVTEGTEGNISTYFGLIAAGRDWEASQLGDNIYIYGWDSTEQRMKIGAKSSDYATAMDVSGSWGAKFLRYIGKAEEALSSQGYAATILRTTSFDTNNFASSIVKGYGDIAGPWTMTVEFGAQAAAAGILYSNYIMEQIYLLQHADGSFPGSTDNWYGGTVAPWTTTMTGVPPTAWVYFAQNKDPIDRIRFKLNIVKSGTGSGTVMSIPKGINCGSDCSKTYTKVQKVKLTANAGTNSTFLGWSGGGCSGTSRCQVTVDSVITMTASFALKTPDIWVDQTPLEFGDVEVKKSLKKTLKITNNGTGDLIVTLSGLAGTEFFMAGKSGITIKPKRSYNLKITFKPISTGEKATTLTLATNDSEKGAINIELSGTGI